MKRLLKWMYVLAALCAVWLAASLNRQDTQLVSLSTPATQQTEAVTSPQQQQHHEATLTDASQLYRICSLRTQRVLLSQAAKTSRTLSSDFALARRHSVKPLHPYHDSRRRLESAPFCLSASRTYYVIALRHIIC